MATSPFDNLTQAFAPQTQQAQLSTDQTRLLMQALRAEQGQRAYNANRPPQLDFNVDARTPFEGIAKGIGSGLSNGLQLRAYGQQNRALQQQQQQQQTYLAQQQALLQQQAQAESGRQTNYLGSLKSNPAYANLVMPYEMGNASTRGDIEKLVADNEAKRTFTPLLGTASGQGEFNKQNAIRTGAEGLGYGANNLEVGGAPQPVAINNYRMLTGQTPTLTQDLEKTEFANISQDLANRKAGTELGVLPQQLAQGLAKGDLDIEKQQYDNQIRKIEASFEEQAQSLKIRKDEQGLSDITNGRNLFNQLRDSGELYSTDPQKQALIQGQLGVYGIKWDAPASGFTPIKGKDDVVYLLDKATGKLGKIEKDGTVKTWNALGASPPGGTSATTASTATPTVNAPPAIDISKLTPAQQREMGRQAAQKTVSDVIAGANNKVQEVKGRVDTARGYGNMFEGATGIRPIDALSPYLPFPFNFINNAVPREN